MVFLLLCNVLEANASCSILQLIDLNLHSLSLDCKVASSYNIHTQTRTENSQRRFFENRQEEWNQATRDDRKDKKKFCEKEK